MFLTRFLKDDLFLFEGRQVRLQLSAIESSIVGSEGITGRCPSYGMFLLHEKSKEDNLRRLFDKTRNVLSFRLALSENGTSRLLFDATNQIFLRNYRNSAILR